MWSIIELYLYLCVAGGGGGGSGGGGVGGLGMQSLCFYYYCLWDWEDGRQEEGTKEMMKTSPNEKSPNKNLEDTVPFRQTADLASSN